MLKVPVVTAWLVNAFENSSEYSEHYLDLQTGKLCYYAPMDFPEHEEKIKKMDSQPESYVRLPKLENALDLMIKQNFIDTVANPVLKEILGKALVDDVDFRKVMMEDDHEEARREWYGFQNEKYALFLKEWFRAKGIELVEAEAPGKTDPGNINR